MFDVWLSHEAFEAFRQREAAAIERFSRLMAHADVIARELMLGSFYMDELDEGDDLVPA